MKKSYKIYHSKLFLAFFLFSLTWISSFSQSAGKPHFIGINPSFTVEPFYEKGEFDVNVVPIVYQHALGQRVDIRLNTIVNYGVRFSGSKISHFGLETAFPIFLIPRENSDDPSSGLYLAPIFSYTRNQVELHKNYGFWAEPGYNLLFDNDFAISIGVQFGRTFFNYDNGARQYGPHFGVKVILGKWF